MFQTIQLEDVTNLPVGTRCCFVRLPILNLNQLNPPLLCPALQPGSGWFDYRDYDDVLAQVDNVCDHNDFEDEELLVLVTMIPPRESGTPTILLAPISLDDDEADESGDEFADESGDEFESGEYDPDDDDDDDDDADESDDSGRWPNGSMRFEYDPEELNAAESDDDIASDDDAAGGDGRSLPWQLPERLE